MSASPTEGLRRRDLLKVSALAAASPLAMAAAAAEPVGSALRRPAVKVARPTQAVLQAAARAGTRCVAVGERGLVLLSDDDGRQWRQVPVPVSAGLTAVTFVDARHGWIVGHGGVVLVTHDGGESWAQQLDGLRIAALMMKDAEAAGDTKAMAEAKRLIADGADKPLLDVLFRDALHGIVVGAYNLALATSDGGATWQPLSRALDNPKGLHLYAARQRGDEVLLAGEQGLVLRSTDGGRRFARLATPYRGSFFTVALDGGEDIVVAGLRGNVLRSQDHGATWQPLPMTVPVSFTASAVDETGRWWLANQAGMTFALLGNGLQRVPGKLAPINGLLVLPRGRALALTTTGVMPFDLSAGVSR
jgi:photosystem II stability/assembly factor-like uncharacterized protein